MANVLLVGLGSSGDVNPLLGIGSALADRGHRTTLVSAPPFAHAAAAIGADFSPIGTREEYEAVYAHPHLWHPRRGLGVFFPYAAGLADETAAVVEARFVEGETVVVATFQCFGARVAQEALGVPVCTVLPNPILVQSVHDPGRSPMGNPPRWLGKGAVRLMYRIANREISRHARSGVNGARATRGLEPPVLDIVGWSRSPDRVLALWPAILAPPQPDWPPQVRTTGFIRYDGPASVGWSPPDHLPDRSDWLVFTPGTRMTHGRTFFDIACEASVRLRTPTLLVARDRSALPEILPEGVWHLEYAPFAWLFERAATVVHHGGIGTAGRALEAGVPQVIVPSGFDQFDNAERVARLGVGRRLRRRDLTAAALEEAIEELATDARTMERCRDVRGELATSDALEATCREIERLVGLPGAGGESGGPATGGATA
ncbi:MAG TPA: glycosyltransferase [Longimicrobiales bacterium]|nr:glycosyltransferase [Longimicrobiales bacterium]